MSNDTIRSFLRATRRRIWLESALRQLRIAIWATSGVLLLLAFVHIGLSPMRFNVAVAVATATGLIAMLPALFSRPSLAECALRADRHFDGHSLITTAHELGRMSDSRPARQTVLARATSMAADSRPHLGSLWQAPQGITFVVAIVPAFFAALLLELPPRDGALSATTDEHPGPTGNSEAASDPFDAASDLPKLRDAIAQSAMDKYGPARTQVADADSSAPLPGDAQDRAAAQHLQPVATNAQAPGIASATNDDSADPGAARRRPDEGEARPDELSLFFSARADTAVARHGAAAAGRGGGSAEFAAQAKGMRPEAIHITPVPAPTASTAWTTLTAAEVAYARTYLEAVGRPHE